MEHDFPRVLSGLGSLRHVEDHVSLDFLPEADRVVQITLHHHGTVDGTHRCAGDDIDLNPQFCKRLPCAGLVGTPASAAGQNESRLFFTGFHGNSSFFLYQKFTISDILISSEF